MERSVRSDKDEASRTYRMRDTQAANATGCGHGYASECKDQYECEYEYEYEYSHSRDEPQDKENSLLLESQTFIAIFGCVLRCVDFNDISAAISDFHAQVSFAKLHKTTRYDECARGGMEGGGCKGTRATCHLKVFWGALNSNKLPGTILVFMLVRCPKNFANKSGANKKCKIIWVNSD